MSRLLLLCFSLTKPVQSSPMWLDLNIRMCSFKSIGCGFNQGVAHRIVCVNGVV